MYAKINKTPKHVGEPPYAVVDKMQQVCGRDHILRDVIVLLVTKNMYVYCYFKQQEHGSFSHNHSPLSYSSASSQTGIPAQMIPPNMSTPLTAQNAGNQVSWNLNIFLSYLFIFIHVMMDQILDGCGMMCGIGSERCYNVLDFLFQYCSLFNLMFRYTISISSSSSNFLPTHRLSPILPVKLKLQLLKR